MNYSFVVLVVVACLREDSLARVFRLEFQVQTASRGVIEIVAWKVPLGSSVGRFLYIASCIFIISLDETAAHRLVFPPIPRPFAVTSLTVAIKEVGHE